MGVNYNPKIVTDGLVLYLDAANPKSYPGSGDTVYDLTGNNQTITSYQTLTVSDGAFDFPWSGGAEQAAGLSISNNAFLLTDFTMESTFYIYGAHFHYDAALMSSGNWNGSHWSFSITQANTAFRTRNPYITVSYSFNTGQWYRGTYRRSGTNVSFFVNGKLISTVTSGTAIPLISGYTNTAIGRETYLNGYFNFNGLISTSSIYSRALSDIEIKNNFNAIRGRYGI